MKLPRILDIGGIALVFLATAFGAILANFYAAGHGRGRHHSARAFIVVTVVSTLVAGGIVLRDELRSSDSKRKRARLGSRIINGFSHGFAWRGAGDALELFAELLVGGA